MIIGCGGQDGSFLAEHLLDEGYEVLGIVRSRDKGRVPLNLQGIEGRLRLAQIDVTDIPGITQALEDFAPSEVYDFAAPSFGPDAWTDPAHTAAVGTVAVAGLLEAARRAKLETRVFFASSSWVFGTPDHSPQDENTPKRPVEPYGVAKSAGMDLVRCFRERYSMHATSAVYFNHESPRRSERFVTRKITVAASRIARGSELRLSLGDLEARRDWGYAKDYVRAAWLAVQHDEPRDYVVATGELHSVQEFVATAFARVNLDWREFVDVDEALTRPTGGVADLVGDAGLARRSLGWRPSVTFEELVELMMDADLAARTAR